MIRDLFPGMFRLAVALAAAAVPAASADVTLLREVRQETVTFAERTQRSRSEERIRAQADRVRIDNLTLGQSLVVRLDRREVIHLNLLRKTASALTFDALAARRAAALDGVRGARDLVRDTPDAARLDTVLRGFGVFLAGPPKVERRASGEKATIAGREASHVRVDVNGEALLDLWMADTPAEAVAYLHALAALQAVPPGVAETLLASPGLPLREDSRYAWFLDRIHVQAEATGVDVAPIPAAEFEIPAGFKPAPFVLLPEDEAKEVVLPPPDEKK
jgi:hypothetical protein